MQYETVNIFYSIVALILLEGVEVCGGINCFGWDAVPVLVVGVSLPTVCAMSSALSSGSGTSIDSAMLMLVHEVSQVWRTTSVKHLLRALTCSSPAKAK